MKTKNGHELKEEQNGVATYWCDKGDGIYHIDSGHAAAPCEGCGVILNLHWDVRLEESLASAEKHEASDPGAKEKP